MPTLAFALERATVWRPQRSGPGRAILLEPVTWSGARGERWAVLGPNGAGKTTLLHLVAALAHPSTGTVSVLGGTLGRVDLAALRRRVGFVDPALARSIRPTLTAVDVTLTGWDAMIAYFPERYDGTARSRAGRLLDDLGCSHVRDRPFGVLSQGERKRVLLARSLIADPELLVLDEPAAGLDVPGREMLISSLDRLARTRPDLTTVLVTHHVEELPATTTHALLLRAGRVVAAGPVEKTLRDESLGACFGLSLAVERRSDGRWSLGAAHGHGGPG